MALFIECPDKRYFNDAIMPLGWFVLANASVTNDALRSRLHFCTFCLWLIYNSFAFFWYSSTASFSYPACLRQPAWICSISDDTELNATEGFVTNDALGSRLHLSLSDALLCFMSVISNATKSTRYHLFCWSLAQMTVRMLSRILSRFQAFYLLVVLFTINVFFFLKQVATSSILFSTN